MLNPEKFPLAAEAEAELDLILKRIQQAVESKKYALGQQKQAYKKNMAEKNAKLESLNTAAQKVLEAVDQAVSNIDVVLKENGSSNDNN